MYASMNERRSEWAYRTLLVFMQHTGTDKEDALSDLLCDLMHWCDEDGTDFDAELARARNHCACEVEYPEEA